MKKKRVLGIDLRYCAVKVAELRKTAKGPLLENFGTAEIDSSLLDKHPDKETAQAKALAQLLAKNKIKAREAVVVISGSSVVIKKLSLPQMPHAEIVAALKLQISKFITFPISEAVFDFYSLSPTSSTEKKSINYIVAVAKKDLIEQVLQVAKKAKIKVISISMVPLALEQAFSPVLKNEVTSLVYMGKNSTNISIFKNKELEFNREVRLGGESITRAMTGVVFSDKGNIELNRESAEKLKRSYGIPLDLEAYSKETNIPADKLAAMIRPALEKIEAEILRSFDYYGSPVGYMVLTGGSSKTGHILEALSEAVKVKAEKGVPALASRVKSEELPLLSTAIGAALDEGNKINLLPNEIKNKWKVLLQNICFNPRNIIAFFVAFLILFYGAQLYQYISVKSDLDLIQEKLEVAKPKLQRLQLLQQRLHGAALSTGTSDFIKLLDELDKIMPSKISLSALDYNKKKGTLIIAGVSSSSISDFTLKLKQSALIKEVELTNFGESSKDKGSFAFELFCRLNK